MCDAIGLGLVQPVLDVIAREAGCDVSRYMVWMNAGQSMQIDLHDPEWDAELPARRVFKAIGAAVELHTNLPLVEMEKCPNEGGILTVKLCATEAGFVMGMGWR